MPFSYYVAYAEGIYKCPETWSKCFDSVYGMYKKKK